MPVLFAGLLLVSAAAPDEAAAARDSATETGAAAWQRIVGNTIVVQTRVGTYTEFFTTDGMIRHVDQDGATTGRWSLQGPSVCLDYPEDDERACGHFEVTADGGMFVEDDGPRLTFTILPGNPRNL